MKRSISFVLLLCMILLVVVSTAQADEAVIIRPYGDGPVHTVTSDQHVFICARWGACSRGLAQSFRRASSVSMDIYNNDGLYRSVEMPSREYWTRPIPLAVENNDCVRNTDTIWQVKWTYPLGRLPVGEYQIHFVWFTARSIRGGGDYDGDGHMDFAGGEPFHLESDLTLVVVD